MGQINQGKEKFWQRQMDLKERYDGSVREFCEEHGLSPSTFAYWRHKFNRAKRTSALVRSPFVPVEIERVHSSGRGLPDPRWLAEFLSHLSGARQ